MFFDQNFQNQVGSDHAEKDTEKQLTEAVHHQVDCVPSVLAETDKTSICRERKPTADSHNLFQFE